MTEYCKFHIIGKLYLLGGLLDVPIVHINQSVKIHNHSLLYTIIRLPIASLKSLIGAMTDFCMDDLDDADNAPLL